MPNEWQIKNYCIKATYRVDVLDVDGGSFVSFQIDEPHSLDAAMAIVAERYVGDFKFIGEMIFFS